MVGVLERYEIGWLSAEDIEQWADALEARDDLGIECGHEEALREFLFAISTPDTNEQINRDVRPSLDP